MYNIIQDLSLTEKILVIDLTKNFEDNNGAPGAYMDKNLTEYTFKGTKMVNDQHDLTFPMDYKEAAKVDDDGYYDNLTFTNPAWPTELQLLQDYGNHEGAPMRGYIDENLILVGNVVGQESLGWFDGYLVFAVRYGSVLFLYKVIEHDKIDMDLIYCKTPFNSWWYIDEDAHLNPDANVKLWIHLDYGDYYRKDNVNWPNWTEKNESLDIDLKNLKVKELFNPFFVSFAFQKKNTGYDDIKYINTEEDE